MILILLFTGRRQIQQARSDHTSNRPESRTFASSRRLPEEPAEAYLHVWRELFIEGNVSTTARPHLSAEELENKQIRMIYIVPARILSPLGINRVPASDQACYSSPGLLSSQSFFNSRPAFGSTGPPAILIRWPH